jgi:hypothetical protein
MYVDMELVARERHERQQRENVERARRHGLTRTPDDRPRRGLLRRR